MWALGCLVFEIVVGYPLFPGTNTVDQMWRVVQALGPPPDNVVAAWYESSASTGLTFPVVKDGRLKPVAQSMRGHDPRAIAFVEACLQVDPAQRPTTQHLLQHAALFVEFTTWGRRRELMLVHAALARAQMTGQGRWRRVGVGGRRERRAVWTWEWTRRPGVDGTAVMGTAVAASSPASDGVGVCGGGARAAGSTAWALALRPDMPKLVFRTIVAFL